MLPKYWCASCPVRCSKSLGVRDIGDPLKLTHILELELGSLPSLTAPRVGAGLLESER